MKKQEKYLSLLLLFLFLFLLIEKDVHPFSHPKGIHCLALTEKHFHQPDYNCSVCDYILVSNIPPSTKVEIILSDIPAYYSCYIESGSYVNTDYLFSPRAPPVV